MSKLILAEGQEERFETSYYRLTKIPRKKGQKIAYYDRANTELGIACLLGRPCFVNAYRKAKEKDLYVIGSGFTGWHAIYDFVDEYWGIIKWNSKENRKDLIKKVHPDLEEGHFFVTLQNIDFSTFGLPEPSPNAKRLAKIASLRGKYVTVAPIRRTNGFQTRDFTDWPNLIDGIRQMGFNVIATCPKKFAQENLPCEYIEDIAGEDNLMDLELAIHRNAAACFASNTGSAGLMLYANPPLLFIFGGVAGYSPGWDGMRNSLAKIEDYQTRLLQPSPVYGPYPETTKGALQLLKENT